MMRWLILPALALAGGGYLAISLADDPGYVLVQIAGYTIESSLVGLVLLAALVSAAAVLGARLVANTIKLPVKVGGYLQDRRLEHARKQLRLGLQQLAAGQFDRAEIELLKRVADADDPATNYLYAAEAAHRQAKGERRDEYLTLADRTDGPQHPAVLLKRAQLWSEDSRNIEALSTLDELLILQPRNAAAHTLKLNLLAREGRWQELKDSLVMARSIVDKAVSDPLALQAHKALLSQARATGRLELLRAAWQDIDKSLRHDTDLIGHYALLSGEMNAAADGLRLIVAELRTHWHPSLALIYGELDGGDVVRQLAKVEHWINQHGEKPELLLVAGRLCLRNRLWGRARSYFEACLRSYPSPAIRLELGKLLIQQGDDEKLALQLFREGLESSLRPADSKPQQFLPAKGESDALEAPH